MIDRNLQEVLNYDHSHLAPLALGLQFFIRTKFIERKDYRSAREDLLSDNRAFF